MGWNSWNYFFGKVTDKDIRDSADQIVATGMKDAGYIYVNIDDTWEGQRDANGNIQANSKFPDMKALADYVHSKGLKIGIYSGPGPKTCAGYAGLARPRGAGRQNLRLLGHRLPQIRPLQLHPRRHAEAGAQRPGRADAPHARCLRQNGQGACRHRPSHRLLLLPVRLGLGLGVGARHGRQPLAHHRRHPAQLELASIRSSMPSRRVSPNTPAPATGTIPTCSKSATAN